MKNRIYKSLFLGIGSAAVASASYALITPDHTVGSADINMFTEHKTLIASPEPTTEPLMTQPVQTEPPETFNLTEHTIRAGESLSSIFTRLDLNQSDLHKIIHVGEDGAQFSQIAPGKTLQIKTTATGELKQIVYRKNALETVTANRKNDNFDVTISTKKIDKHPTQALGTIHSSLFIDGKAAGLPDKIIMQLAEIFGWDIDFALDIKENDSFAVLYEKRYVEGKEIGAGAILAAEFVNGGKVYKAVRYKNKQGRTDYYTPKGNSLRKAFIRTPVAFARVSSPFNLKRRHPVLNRIRAHKGVDYAAKTGTPVKCTGDGKIVFRGWQHGYGRVIIVQHGKRYSTLYAHLSGFNKRFHKGSSVKQRDIIGYVGQSGLATGPHLHYEFRINGVHRNPLTVALPDSAPLERSSMADFQASTQPLLTQLDHARVAMLNPQP